MKSRVWILIVFFLLIVIVGGYVATFRILDINTKAKDYFSEWISQSFGIDFSAHSVSILPWFIRINEVQIQFKDSPLLITTKKLMIGYNIATLLKNRFNPPYGIEKIYIDEPEFTWFLDTGLSDSDTTIFVENRDLSQQNIPPININIENGKFIFQRADSKFVFADNLSGWLNSRAASLIDINVEGSLLSDETNSTCEGYIETENNSIMVDIAGRDCFLTEEVIEVFSGNTYRGSGKLDFNLHYENEDEKTLLDGTYSVVDGSLVLSEFDTGISDMHIEGHFDESEVFLDSVVGNVWGVTPELTGQVRIKPEPVVDLELHAAGIDIRRALEDVLPDLTEYPEGNLNLSASINGALRDIATHVDVSLDSLDYKNESVQDVTLSMNIVHDALEIEQVRALYNGFDFNGSGISDNITQQTKDFSFEISAENVQEPSKNFSFALNGNADTQNSVYYSDIDLRIHKLDDSISGEITYENDNLKYDIRNEFITLTGSAVDVFDNILIESEITCSRFPVLEYFEYNSSGLIIDGKSTISGDLNKLSAAGGFQLVWGENLNSRMTSEAVFENILESTRTFSINAQLVDHHIWHSHPMVWDVAVNYDELGIHSVITEDAGGVLKLDLPTGGASISGDLDLNDFPLEWIIDIFVREEFSHRGKITGRAIVGGTVDTPWFETPEPVHVTEMSLGGLNRLDGTVYVSGRPGELVFGDANLRRDGQHILQADGKWESGTPFILIAEGKDVSLGAISDLISDSRKTDGTVNYSVTTVFTRSSGTINGPFTIHDGHFLDVPFDTASGVFGGGSDGFMVTDFQVENRGIFNGSGSATSGYLWKDRTETPGLKMNLSFTGDLIQILPYLTGALEEATGDCRADLTFGGTWQDPIVLDGELVVSDGEIEPSFLFDRVTDIDAVLRIDPDFETATGLKAVRIVSGTGSVNNERLIVQNIHPGDIGWETFSRPELLSLPNETINLDFGVLLGTIEEGRNKTNSLSLHVPGFMKPDETGVFSLSGIDSGSFIVGSSDFDDYLTPYISGTITILSGDIYYPFVSTSSDETVSSETEDEGNFIEDIFWDIIIDVGSNVNYVNEKNLELGRFAGTTLWQNEVKIDENSTFEVRGRLSEDSFRVTGNARSSYGIVSFYGYRFDIERAELELDTANVAKPAILTGRARTVVIDDSTGVENEIYLHVSFIDRESGEIQRARDAISNRDNDYYDMNRPQTRFDAGALGIVEIRFSSNNPSDNTQEKILARLGVSPGNIGVAATRALTAGIDNYYFNPLMRPFEEKIKKVFRLDMVKITPSFLGNFAQSRLSPVNTYDPSTNYILFDRSRIMLGEYFMKDWFVSYTGQYGVSKDYLSRKERGFYHDFALQYLLDRNFRIQGRYIRDEIIKQDDKRLELKYDFLFE